MKKNRSCNLALLLFVFLFAQESFAQTTLEGHSDPGNSMVFSSTGNIYASESLGGDHWMWHLPDGAIMRLGKRAIGRWDRALGRPMGELFATAQMLA